YGTNVDGYGDPWNTSDYHIRKQPESIVAALNITEALIVQHMGDQEVAHIRGWRKDGAVFTARELYAAWHDTRGGIYSVDFKERNHGAVVDLIAGSIPTSGPLIQDGFGYGGAWIWYDGNPGQTGNFLPPGGFITGRGHHRMYG